MAQEIEDQARSTKEDRKSRGGRLKDGTKSDKNE